MKKVRMIVVLVSLACLIAAGGTVAWLVDSDETTNTFSVGKIGIQLTEPTWPGTDVSQKLYPGAVISKDPTVTVAANSEDCWVYVMIDNELNQALPNSVAMDIDTVHWNLVKTSGSRTLYRYSGVVTLASSARELEKVFTKVTVDKDLVTESNIDLLNGKAIKVKAYAHQSNAINPDEVDTKVIAFFAMT